MSHRAHTNPTITTPSIKLTDGGKKLKIVEGLFMLAHATKTFQLKKKHPEWTAQQIQTEVMKLIEQGCR